jgi:hypothetical protein
MNGNPPNTFNCPSCGAPVNFRSAAIVLAQCGNCKKGVVRHDLNLELIGQEAILQADMSPFQPGTSGVYEGKTFDLLGRLKVVYDQGTWSEWYALFHDGTVGWLAEAQGLYMMSFEKARDVHYPPSVKVGMKFTWDKVNYEIDDIRQITYLGYQGELPYTFQQGYRALSLDFRSPEGLFASATITSEEGMTLYTGKYMPFESFRFTNLRQIDGWDLH